MAIAKKDGKGLADLLFPTTSGQDDFAESILNIPPEQRKLHTETYDFAVQTIFDKLRDKSIHIPEFQRRYVWSDAQASRLIESLIIQCPIPVIYLNQEKDETMSVIDGNQRLTSINHYLNNEFPLKGLTAYPELEGNRFFELDDRFQRHILNRTLRCIVILKDTHPQVKFDVFERLNSGSVKLNPQELRHGLYFGDAIQLATSVVKTSNFLELLDIKVDKRMKAEELVMRFLALSQDFENYKKPLAGFINSFVDARRTITAPEEQRLAGLFAATLAKVRALFGDLAFKIFSPTMVVESKFNAALFDAEMVAVAQLQVEDHPLDMPPKIVQGRLANLFVQDVAFTRAISVATSDEQQVRLRVQKIKAILL